VGILHVQLSAAETRPGAWAFLLERFGALARGMRSDEAGGLIGRVGGLCDEAQRAEAEARLGPAVAAVDDGPRRLKRALERVRVCAAQQRELGPQVQEFLRTRAGAPASTPGR
jgi:cytosol alanyl aminopeptidase